MSYTHKCIYCGSSFETKRTHSKYCSKNCQKNWIYHNNPKLFKYSCKVCHKEYEGRKSKGKYCSISCANKDRSNEDVEKTCKLCSSTWTVPYHQRNKTEFCSYSCATKSMWNSYNNKEKDEHAKKISVAHKEGVLSGRIKHPTGIHSKGWQGGKTKLSQTIRGLLKYKEWREFVYKRDDYTCQHCNTRGSGTYLNVDHIKPLAKILREKNIKTTDEALECQALWDTKNGRTLCIDCHKKTDTYGGGARA